MHTRARVAKRSGGTQDMGRKIGKIFDQPFRRYCRRVVLRAGSSSMMRMTARTATTLLTVVLILVVACGQTTGALYISTQTPDQADDPHYVIRMGGDSVEDIEFSQKLEIVAESQSIASDSLSEDGTRAGHPIDLETSPFALTVPYEDVVSNLDESALAEVAVGLGVISSSDAEARGLAASDDSNNGSGGPGGLASDSAEGAPFGLSSGSSSGSSSETGGELILFRRYFWDVGTAEQPAR